MMHVCKLKADVEREEGSEEEVVAREEKRVQTDRHTIQGTRERSSRTRSV